ncbi:MAG: hypothetical protein KAH32_07995, partial [Chlamydiia bacterium]|nr:hypothetical protein [Chlamydiia bacterium]
QNRIAANMTYLGFQSSRRKIQIATDVTIRINREITRVSKIISDLADQRSKIYGDAHEAGVRL